MKHWYCNLKLHPAQRKLPKEAIFDIDSAQFSTLPILVKRDQKAPIICVTNCQMSFHQHTMAKLLALFNASRLSQKSQYRSISRDGFSNDFFISMITNRVFRSFDKFCSSGMRNWSSLVRRNVILFHLR